VITDDPIEKVEGVHSDSASLGSNPSPPAKLFSSLEVLLPTKAAMGITRVSPDANSHRDAECERPGRRGLPSERAPSRTPAGFDGGDGARSVEKLRLSCGGDSEASATAVEITQPYEKDRPPPPGRLLNALSPVLSTRLVPGGRLRVNTGNRAPACFPRVFYSAGRPTSGKPCVQAPSARAAR